MNIKKIIVYVVIIAAALAGYQAWSDKPYCTIEFLDATTTKGKKNPFSYAISKMFSQRRELFGDDPYKMYVYLNDLDGIESYKLTVNGKEIPIKFDKANSYESELNGESGVGMHHYELMVSDKKGKTGKAECYIKVSLVGGVLMPGI